MKQSVIVPLTSLFLVLSFCAHTVVADEAEDRGLEIAKEAEAQSQGWSDLQSSMKMVLRNRHGQESIRYMRILTLENQEGGDKSMTIFDRPKDVKGTALLTHAHINKPDDQWLYLPALKRVKRISSRNKSGPFMGSEFAYEDMGSQEIDKYTYRYLRDEPCGENWSCYVSERFPRDRKSGYSRQVSWVDKEHYRIVRVDYYDRKKSLLKTLELGDYRLYLERFWRAHTLTMTNHQTEKSTTLEWEKYAFNVGLTDSDFTRQVLKRAR